MAYSQAAEEARIVINLDFSLVVPGGTFYQFNEEKIPEETASLPEGAKVVLDFATPKPVRTGTDLNDPVTRGVIRNYTAGLFIDRYSVDVKQETALSSRYAIAIYGLKTSREGVGYFVIVTARGLYEGRAVIQGMANKERLDLVEQILKSLTPYESTPAEIDAARAKVENAKKEEERRQMLAAEAEKKRAEAAAREEEAKRQAEAAAKEEEERKQAEAAVKEEEERKQAKAVVQEEQVHRQDEAVAREEEHLQSEAAQEASAQTQGASPEIEVENQTEETLNASSGRLRENREQSMENISETEQKSDTEQEMPKDAELAESVTAEGSPAAVNAEGEDAKTGDAACDDQTSADEPEAGSESEEDEETRKKRIAELETKRRQHLEELRAKFSGNPQVEAGIDNYIARVDRTGDEVVAAFRKFLRGVQEYASTTPFTSENDPNYVNMLGSIRQEEKSLGRKLDDLTRSVDSNVSDAVDAGVTEAYVERMIRMVERLAAKYDKLSVAFNGRDRIAYLVPAEISAIVLKWQKFRENLPSQLEETDKRREMEVSSRIQADILEKRASFVDRQNAVEAARLEMEASAKAADAAENSFDEFEKSYESQRSSIEDVHEGQVHSNDDAVNALNDQLDSQRQEVSELNEELSRTFALNRGRKKELTTKINDLNAQIAENEERLMQLQDATSGFENDASQQISALDAQRENLRAAAQAARSHSDDMKTAYETAAADFEKMKEDLAREEEEWKHVHENYLAGMYDD